MEFDGLGIAKKLVKYVVHLIKKNLKKVKIKSSHMLPKHCQNSKIPVFGFKEFYGLTPKHPRVFFTKIASKQPLLKAR
jgi:hypothetical protein